MLTLTKRALWTDYRDPVSRKENGVLCLIKAGKNRGMRALLQSNERREKMVKALKGKVTTKTAKKKSPTKRTTAMPAGMKKEYLKSTNVCKVTFQLPEVAAVDAKTVHLVGDFNNWSVYANPMKRLKSGHYTVKLELEPGREYQFRYLIDESKWENDWNADKYVTSPYGDSDNSVIIV
jgi:1,4-alpha-glucan branching enzyme